MIIKDLSEYKTAEGTISLKDQIRAIMKHGLAWRKEQESQEKFIAMVKDILDNKCLLLRNVKIPKIAKPIPLVLLTPAGITLVNPKDIQGSFQIRDTTWRELNRQNDLVPTKPNPIREVETYANALQSYFESHNLQDLPIESIVALTSMGAHVDANHPAVRILPLEALRNFAREIGASQGVLSREEIAKLAKLLVKPRPPSYSTPSPEWEDSPHVPSSPVIPGLESLIKKLNFSKRQWILLGGILIVQVLLLIILIVLVLSTS